MHAAAMNLDSNGPCLPQALQDFIDTLNICAGIKPLDFLVSAVERFSPDAALLEPWIHFDPDVYMRNPVYRDKYMEVLVLTWQSGQRSPIHNHRGSSCCVYVVEGIASEIHFEKSPQGALFPVQTTHFPQGTTCGSVDQEIHQIVNLQPADCPLVSMHIYSPPLQTMDLFSLSQSTFADYDDLLIRAVRKS